MESSDEVAARFDERSVRYDDSAMHRGLAAAVAGFVSLDGVHDVLDVATGTGLLLRSLPSGAALTLAGVDISRGMLAVAQEHLPSARFLRADAAQLPFEHASFDLITCVSALHIMPDPAAAVTEWRRVLRPGGRIVIATFAIDDPATGQRGAAKVGHGPSTLEQHEPFGTRTALERFAATTELSVTRSQTWVFPATGRPKDVCLITEFAPA